MVFQKIRANLAEGTEGFEQVVFCHDRAAGLKAIIAVHSTVLGPGVGGCRMWNYANEDEALVDVLRLSKGMTYKASVAGLDWGGGKAVIVGDAKKDKSPQLLARFGEYVNRLGGTYVTAKDVGIGADDLRQVKSKTKHVLGIEGEAGSSGDPSPATAWGVYHGMRAAHEFATGSKSLAGKRIALQGLGSVSYYLLEHLAADGAKMIGCDVDAAVIDRAVQKYGIEIVSPDAIYDVPCDVFSPSALGATINGATISRIAQGGAKVIAGAANNQLATDADGVEVMRKGLVYAPDYVINAGGLINIYYEGHEAVVTGGYSRAKAFAHIGRIGDTVQKILERSKSEELPSQVIADRIAEERVTKARAKKQA